MKTTFLIIAIIYQFMACNSTNNQNQKDCFSKENFQKVHDYIDNKNKEDGSAFIMFNEYEVHLSSEERIISIKKNNCTLSVIDADKGIYSLNKSEKQNKKMVNSTYNIFCKLLAMANK